MQVMCNSVNMCMTMKHVCEFSRPSHVLNMGFQCMFPTWFLSSGIVHGTTEKTFNIITLRVCNI